MKNFDKTTALNISAILLFVAGIITFAVGGNNTTGFLFTTTGFLFLTLGIGARRKEDAKAEDIDKIDYLVITLLQMFNLTTIN